MTQKGVEFETINYLDEPLTAEALKRLLRSAGLKPSQAVRSNEPAYRELVAAKNLSEDELLRLMVEHPQLIQRPIVVRGGKAVLARPTERLKDLGI